MTPLNIRLHGNNFHDVINGKTEIVKYASNKRIHHLCFSRVTHDCKEPQSKCRECFEAAMVCDGYMCYPYDKAILRKGKTDRYITKAIEDIRWEERKGKVWFVFKLKCDEDKPI